MTPATSSAGSTAAETGGCVTVTLTLDPATHAELERAAGHRDVGAYLYVLAGRYARWNELREWLSRLEAAYGALPPEAVEGVHRQVLGLPRREPDPGTLARLTLTLSPEEFAALGRAAGDRPLAPYARDVLVDHLTSGDRPDDAGDEEGAAELAA